MRTHVRNKHQGQVTMKKTAQYTIREMSPEPNWPKKPKNTPYRPTKVLTCHYYQQPLTTNQYICQQSLKKPEANHVTTNTYRQSTQNYPHHTSITPRKDARLPSEQSTPISNLDDETLAELEALNKELLTDLALLDPRSSTPIPNENLSVADSALSTPNEDSMNGYQLENHPKYWLILDSIRGQNGPKNNKNVSF